MSTRIITISDADLCRDYVLCVDFDRLPPEPEVGYPGGVELGKVLCSEIRTWCGDYAVSGFPAHDCIESLERKIGEWCREKCAAEIDDALWVIEAEQLSRGG